VVIAIDITRRKNAEKLVREEREHLRRLLDLQERERQLVAYEIHDGLTQYLTGGIMHLESSAESKKAAQAKKEYDRGIILLREALSEARRLISGLRPPVLDELGIVAALEYLVNESRDAISELELVTQVEFDRLAAPLEVAIFRVAQEALTNIRKHSGASKARIELVQHGRWVRLVVRDWGSGFNPATTHEERYGLQGIRQRARLLGTAAVIESTIGQGTEILIDFPLVVENTSNVIE
jgi:signal transduction histidine kinase